MSNQEIKNIILRIVEAGGPVKYTTLALSTMDYIGPALFHSEQFNEILADMILDKEITEIRYKQDGHVRSMYASRLTEVV